MRETWSDPHVSAALTERRTHSYTFFTFFSFFLSCEVLANESSGWRPRCLLVSAAFNSEHSHTASRIIFPFLSFLHIKCWNATYKPAHSVFGSLPAPVLKGIFSIFRSGVQQEERVSMSRAEISIKPRVRTRRTLSHIPNMLRLKSLKHRKLCDPDSGLHMNTWKRPWFLCTSSWACFSDTPLRYWGSAVLRFCGSPACSETFSFLYFNELRMSCV